MADYSMILLNQSKNPGYFCVFQEYNGKIKNVVSLAWQVAPANPSVTQKFEWTINYGATFSNVKKLNPGTILTQSQVMDVDPQKKEKRACTLLKDEYAYYFERTSTEASTHIEPGHMGIFTEDSVLNDDVAIGLTMSNKSMYATMATPNYTYDFEVTPNYKVIFVQTLKVGQILTVTQMTTQVAEVIYDEGRFSKTVILDSQNRWHVEDTDAVCARLLNREDALK